MYCDKCGSKINSSDDYCPTCGASIGKKGEENSNIGIIFAIIAFITFWFPLVSIPFAIVAIIKGKKNSVAATILGIISLLLSILITGIIILGCLYLGREIVSGDIFDNIDMIIDKYTDRIEEKFGGNKRVELRGSSWMAGDESILLLKENGEYFWYASLDMSDSNYSKGRYVYYNGLEAINRLSKEYGEYGYSFGDLVEEADDRISNYYLITLDCEKYIKNGDEDITKKEKNVYYGYVDGDTLKLTNVKSKDKISFILSTKDKDNEETL